MCASHSDVTGCNGNDSVFSLKGMVPVTLNALYARYTMKETNCNGI
jgi:hypothetical protein